jgi:hypothetical protein
MSQVLLVTWVALQTQSRLPQCRMRTTTLLGHRWCMTAPTLATHQAGSTMPLAHMTRRPAAHGGLLSVYRTCRSSKHRCMLHKAGTQLIQARHMQHSHVPASACFAAPCSSDQQRCSLLTCSVAHAIAKAVQMSVAVTLRRAPGNFSVSPQALYYCATPAGRSCKTG